MKNSLKNKKSIIAARVMLILLLLSILMLTSCPGYGHREVSLIYHSYDEMLEYAISHKQEFHSDPCVFLMFDIDKYENISTEYYIAETMWYDAWSDFWNLSKDEKIASNHFPFNIVCHLKMNAVLENNEIIEDAYKIQCKYAGVINSDSVQESTVGIIKSNINAIDPNNSDQYISTYNVFVEKNQAIDISIAHQHNATQEELDTIVLLLINNAVIK